MLKDHDYVLAKLDSVKNSQAAREFGIGSFPTIKFFYNGKQKEFDG